MPILSRFLGIVVYMNYADHAPPHFHARYGGHEAMIGIDPVVVLRGRLPPRIVGLIVEWASKHQTLLLMDWELARERQPLLPIEPLE
jgi:hypothetical protein